MPRPRASEVFLQSLNGAADSDITVVLGCASPTQRDQARAGLLAAAAGGPERSAGDWARSLEPVRRIPAAVAQLRLSGTPTRVGPIDVAEDGDDPTRLVVRWSHLAGDARSCQEAVLDGLERGGSGVEGGCRCVRLPVGATRPMTGADAWGLWQHRGQVTNVTAIRAARSALLPMFRPIRSPLRDRVPPASPAADESDADAVAVFRFPTPIGDGARPSVFSSVAGAVAAMVVAPGRNAMVRVGVTVDVRRHERLDRVETAGNLSVVGYANIPVTAGGDRVGRAAEAIGIRVRSLLAHHFWRQQLAFDAWLNRAPRRALRGGCDLIVNRLAVTAPVLVTELWRDDGIACAGCGRRRRHLPPGFTAFVIPPALPPSGLTCGITRTANRVIVVLRRLTPPGRSAVGWLAAATERFEGAEVEFLGPVRSSAVRVAGRAGPAGGTGPVGPSGAKE